MLITNFDAEESRPTHGGGSADVYRGICHGRNVAIKVVRLSLGNLDEHTKVGPAVVKAAGIVPDPIAFQRFYREAVAWKHLQHPNVLPLLGANVKNQRFAMASEWMDHGNINEFILKHEVNRAQLVNHRTLLTRSRK